MNAQNNLKKPNFSKGVMGYTPSEVDRYIDHINERYNTVSREAAELKRKVINLQLRLDEAEERLAEAEKQSTTKKVFDHGALSQIFTMLERENSRHAQFLDLLKDKLCDMLDDEIKETDDGEWENALDEFIDTPDWSAPAEAVVSKAEDHAEPAAEAEEKPMPETPVFMPIEEYDIPATTAVSDISDDDGEDDAEEAGEAEPAEAVEAEAIPEDNKLFEVPFAGIFGTYDDCVPATSTDLDLPSKDDSPVSAELADDSFDSERQAIWAVLDEIFAGDPSTDTEELDTEITYITSDDVAPELPSEDEDAEADKDTSKDNSKTPAENLAELDFYQDDVHQDGESFDPMTLAKQVTTQRSKVTYEDFFKSMTDGNKK